MSCEAGNYRTELRTRRVSQRDLANLPKEIEKERERETETEERKRHVTVSLG